MCLPGEWPAAEGWIRLRGCPPKPRDRTEPPAPCLCAARRGDRSVYDHRTAMLFVVCCVPVIFSILILGLLAGRAMTAARPGHNRVQVYHNSSDKRRCVAYHQVHKAAGLQRDLDTARASHTGIGYRRSGMVHRWPDDDTSSRALHVPLRRHGVRSQLARM